MALKALSKYGYMYPRKESNSLKVDDIPGAKPRISLATKQVQHYKDALQTRYMKREGDKVEYAPVIRPQQVPEPRKEDVPKVSRKKLLHGMGYEQSVITKEGLLKNSSSRRNSQLEIFDYPRNLAVEDIPGASAGSKKSQFLKNLDLAKKLRNTNPYEMHTHNTVRVRVAPVEQKRDVRFQRHTSFYDDEKLIRTEPNEQLSVDADQIRLKLQENIRNSEKRLQNLLAEKQGSRVSKSVDEKKSVSYYNQPQKADDISNQQDRVNHSQLNYATEKRDTEKSHELPPINNSNRPASSLDFVQRNEENHGVQSIQNLQQYNIMYQGYGSHVPNKRAHPQTAREEFDREREAVRNKIEMKRVMTYNILSNQAVLKVVPNQSRLPYKYGITLDESSFKNLGRVNNHFVGADDQQNPKLGHVRDSSAS